MFVFISISLPNRLTGTCRILVIFSVILLSFITLKIGVVVKSTLLYLYLSFCNNSYSVMVLLFFSSCNKKQHILYLPYMLPVLCNEYQHYHLFYIFQPNVLNLLDYI